MKVAFRTDASLQIGTGHVMRCLTLAHALRDKGAEILFVSREHAGNRNPLIQQSGFAVAELPLSAGDLHQSSAGSEPALDHASWLGASQRQDALLCEPILQEFRPDWLVIDHYAIDSYWQQMLQPCYQKLLVIDDLADRYHECDILLDQTCGRKPKDYQAFVPAKTTLLLGAEYALLRPEFTAWRDVSLNRRANPELKHLLVTMGGIDADNVTGRVLDVLNQCKLPDDIKITVVMGSSAPWLQQVIQQAGLMAYATEVRVDVTNMAEIMAYTDLAMGASGSTSWERCCLGLPAVLVILAENQKIIAEALENLGAAIIVRPDGLDVLPRLLLSMTQEQLTALSTSALKIVDGLGVNRVLETLLSTR